MNRAHSQPNLSLAKALAHSFIPPLRVLQLDQRRLCHVTKSQAQASPSKHDDFSHIDDDYALPSQKRRPTAPHVLPLCPPQAEESGFPCHPLPHVHETREATPHAPLPPFSRRPSGTSQHFECRHEDLTHRLCHNARTVLASMTMSLMMFLTFAPPLLVSSKFLRRDPRRPCHFQPPPHPIPHKSQQHTRQRFERSHNVTVRSRCRVSS
jgi:hypothetical protein